MLRTLVLALLVLTGSREAVVQAPGVLHISVVLAGPDGTLTPVPRHLLLISDNPASAPPRRIFTGVDGTVDVKLAPGNYTVESDRAVAFRGRAYLWTEMLDIAAGQDATLALTADNAEVASVSAATAAAPLAAGARPPLEADPSFLLPRWQDAVAAVWTPTGHASGFLVDTAGLIATNQRAIGSATQVEVQLTAEVKVAARVLAADAARDVAVLWINPALVAAVPPVPLGCGQTSPTVVDGQDLFALGVGLREPKGMTPARAGRVQPHAIASDFTLALGSAGGPVFTGAGEVLGITAVMPDREEDERGAVRVIPIADTCGVMTAALERMKALPVPAATRLPVEPTRPFPVKALEDAAQRRAGRLNPYQMSSSDFDIAFITPVHTYGSESRGGRDAEAWRRPDASTGARALSAFANWYAYVEDVPPVLLIRVTPKLVEGFWTMVARGAARTQGVALPPITRFTSGFSRLRAFCGDAEVTPIHPFRLEQRISDEDAIHEGLYAFDPSALGPGCTTVRLMLYSEKEPEKGDSRLVAPNVIQGIWELFAPYRAAQAPPADAGPR